jgi:hypothetical protein
MTKSPESVRWSRHATALSLGTGNELEHPSSHGNGDLGMARLGGLVKMSVVSSVRRSTRPRHRALGQAGLGRHRPGRPVRGVLRRRLQRLEHHRLDPLVGNRARRPGRGSSRSPSSRSATNRARHLPTVPRPTSNSSATSVFEPPPALRNTIRDRNAKASAVFGRRGHRSSASISCSLRTRPASCGVAHPIPDAAAAF